MLIGEPDAITEQIIGCAFAVSRVLRPGFLERPYQNALVIELEEIGLPVERQVPLRIWYKDRSVGDYIADLVVAGRVLVELKAVRALNDAHIAQCLNYLSATKLPVCLLLNVGTPRVEVRRVSLTEPSRR
jgi:GxxExxY protein